MKKHQLLVSLLLMWFLIKKIGDIENKTPELSNLVTNAALNAKIGEN